MVSLERFRDRWTSVKQIRVSELTERQCGVIWVADKKTLTAHLDPDGRLLRQYIDKGDFEGTRV